MVFIRAKYITGEYYFYLVESRREGKLVHQDIVRYLGKQEDAERYARENNLKMPDTTRTLEKTERTLDEQIAQKKKTLDSLRPFPRVLEERLREELIILWTYHSTAIEGSTLSPKETATLLAEGIVVGNKPLTDYLAAKGHRDAVNLVFSWVDQGKEALSEADLLELHRAAMKNVIDAYLGAYRRVRVYIRGSSYTPPQPDQVPELMRGFLRELNINPERHGSIELAALTHIDFESIHPFVDGNGRMGRLLANWVLMKNGYPPVVITKGERLRYFKMLEVAQTKFVTYRVTRFFKQKVGAALDFYLKRLKPV
jgi:Fic family protein